MMPPRSPNATISGLRGPAGLHPRHRRAALKREFFRNGRADVEAGAGENGSVLVLALVFLVTVSLIVLALLSWAGNNIMNVAAFKTDRSFRYATGAATEVAIQGVRYNFTNTTPNPANPPSCLSSLAITIPVDNQSVNVWCSTIWTPASTNNVTRQVTISACPTTLASCSATNPYLQAVVSFDDYGAGVIATPTPCSTTCGSSMTVNSWTFNSIKI
jgi:hypothetical protein